MIENKIRDKETGAINVKVLNAYINLICAIIRQAQWDAAGSLGVSQKNIQDAKDFLSSRIYETFEEIILFFADKYDFKQAKNITAREGINNDAGYLNKMARYGNQNAKRNK